MRPIEPSAVSFRRVVFRHFKALGDFSLTLEPVNVLTGPNNSGKSTVIGAFRALAAGLRTARAHNPQRLQGPDGRRLGYPIPRDGIPISLENARTDYGDVESLVTFELSNGNSLQLQFTDAGPCQLFPRLGDNLTGPKDRAEFLRCFPVTVGTVPVLGPVEHDEPLVNKATVDRNLATHRASRNFRNYWYHYPEDFITFAEILADTWPGMELSSPESFIDPDETILRMFCKEERVTRELFWAGFGFQIWCQLLTHLVRERDATILVVDEPETYLHPDLHRRLYHMFKETSRAVLLATHSSELLTEAEPNEVVVVDKTKRSAKRLSNIDAALQAIGSTRTTTVTAVARTERVLFVEGDDARLLFLLAARSGKRELSLGLGITTLALGGHRPGDARAMAKGIRESIGQSVKFAVVLDKDYRCVEELETLRTQLSGICEVVHMHGRKEIENYFLVPRALLRAARKAEQRQLQFSAVHRPRVDEHDIDQIMRETFEDLRIDTQVLTVERRIEFLRSRSGSTDRVTIAREAVSSFEADWASESRRFELAAGKSVLSRLNAALADRFGISLTLGNIATELEADELPNDLQQLLRRLDRFRNRTRVS